MANSSPLQITTARNKSSQPWSVGRSVKLLLAFASTVIRDFINFEIHDQDSNSFSIVAFVYSLSPKRIRQPCPSNGRLL
jgi:hypothetical protein